MKEYFYEKDNEVYILDDEKGLSVEDAKDNTEEMLITQNNIEELECEINFSNEDKKRIEELKKRDIPSTIFMSVVLLLFVAILFDLTIDNMPILGFIGSGIISLFPIINISDIIRFNKNIKMKDKYIKELELELENQNEKLKTLKKTAKNKIVDYTAIKEVPKSEIINDLAFKKDIIKDYIKNKKKYISSYKEGSLNFLLYSNIYNQKDIDFIKYLVEEDLKNENINSKKKVKQKNKTKTL